MEQARDERRYTYGDYLTWPDEPRCEMIDGIVHVMASPTVNHQRIVRNLMRHIGNHLTGAPCEVFQSPLDVCFSEAMTADTLVQPDVFVVCEKEKIRDTRIVGAPTLIVEILSPSTINRDSLIKRNLYEKKGVREYWLVSPQEKNIRQCILEKGRYTDQLVEKASIHSSSIDGLSISVDDVFEGIE